MDEGGGEDDAGTELFQCYGDDGFLRHASERCGKNRAEHSNRASSENDEEQSNAEPLVVLVIRSGASSISLGAARTVPMNGMVSRRFW